MREQPSRESAGPVTVVCHSWDRWLVDAPSPVCGTVGTVAHKKMWVMGSRIESRTGAMRGKRGKAMEI